MASRFVLRSLAAMLPAVTFFTTIIQPLRKYIRHATRTIESQKHCNTCGLSPRFHDLLLGFLLCRRQAPSEPADDTTRASIVSDRGAVQTEPACQGLPGSNDTVVVLKTGATELRDKLPVHLRTTLICYPSYLIFSDFAERFQEEDILDALDEVDPTIKETHSDFALYRQLQESGRASLDPAQLSGPTSLPQDSTSGKPTNPGWKLDKWKFLPMIRKTLQEYPDKQWYIFVETDTYVFWSTLLAYLAALDPSRPFYMGSQMQIGEVLFAHGGSGFVVSRPALELAVAQYADSQIEWEAFTAEHWAGDCVLGKVLKQSGTSVTWAWPIWQGANLGQLDYDLVDYGRSVWCSPTVSYHHLSPSAIEDLWTFEQDWISRQQSDSNHSLTLRHRDVYAEYVLPQTSAPKSDWDNYSHDDRGTASSFEDCQRICENDLLCVQYSLNLEYGRCFTASQPRLGDVSSTAQSGWLSERMHAFHDKGRSCSDEGWIT